MYIQPAQLPTTTQELRFIALRMMEMVNDKTINEQDVFGLSLYLSKLIDEMEVSQ